jgi:hypothetical protein
MSPNEHLSTYIEPAHDYISREYEWQYIMIKYNHGHK